MKLFGRNLKKEVAIVAEIGVNHEGKISTAINIMKVAINSGVDAIKFQFYSPEKYQSIDNINRFKRVKKFSLSDQNINKIISLAKKKKIFLFGTPVSEDKVDLCNSIGPAIKIASGDIDFLPTLKKVSKLKKKIILSTGNSSFREINNAIKIIKKHSRSKIIKKKLILLHCVSSYPTLPHEANLLRIKKLKKKFPNFYIGYSNHVIEKEAVISSVALGAKIIEVHVTDDKLKHKFKDHKLSFDKYSLPKLVKSIRLTNKMIHSYGEGPSPSEKNIKKLMRKGLIAIRDLKKNQTIARKDIGFARPSTYFNSNQINTIIGKKVTRNIFKGKLIKKKFLD